jgi:hypothetical protein
MKEAEVWVNGSLRSAQLKGDDAEGILQETLHLLKKTRWTGVIMVLAWCENGIKIVREWC